MEVRIPTPLRSYTGGEAAVEASGATVAEVLDHLDQQFPGIRFRMIDEAGQVRRHMKLFVNAELTRDLTRKVGPTDVVTVMQALSGG